MPHALRVDNAATSNGDSASEKPHFPGTHVDFDFRGHSALPPLAAIADSAARNHTLTAAWLLRGGARLPPRSFGYALNDRNGFGILEMLKTKLNRVCFDFCGELVD